MKTLVLHLPCKVKPHQLPLLDNASMEGILAEKWTRTDFFRIQVGWRVSVCSAEAQRPRAQLMSELHLQASALLCISLAGFYWIDGNLEQGPGFFNSSDAVHCGLGPVHLMIVVAFLHTFDSSL